MPTKATSVIIVLGGTLIMCLAASVAQDTVVGTYRTCPFHCETLEIRPDGTFVRVLDGDAFNNQRGIGSWERNGEFLILTSADQPCSRPMKERSAGRDGSIEILLRDPTGDAVLDVEVAVYHEDLELRSDPDGEGRVQFPVPWTSLVEVSGFPIGECTFRPKSRDSDTFAITLEPAEVPPIVGERYRITDDGVIRVLGPELKRVAQE